MVIDYSFLKQFKYFHSHFCLVFSTISSDQKFAEVQMMNLQIRKTNERTSL
jgi:hypothetical protein